MFNMKIETVFMYLESSKREMLNITWERVKPWRTVTVVSSFGVGAFSVHTRVQVLTLVDISAVPTRLI